MNLIKKILLAGGLVLAIYGCKKGPSPDNYISYKVDGVYKSLKPEADYFDESLVLEAGKINGEGLWIVFYGYPYPGTYSLADTTLTAPVISYNLGDDIYDTILSRTGTLVITSYDGKHVSGTFEFKGSNGTSVKTITEGQFKAKVDQLGDSSPCSIDSTCYVDTTYGFTPRGKLLKHLKLIRAEKSNSINKNN
ncbi:DUF6252 family protein [Mucilaginibacter sp. McL0603]|uniref:DUF6252 family protein n=1 Tax=Mucilaginibacter sp. McL0603 TaxID=3415670 RepID=UPI003CF950A0